MSMVGAWCPVLAQPVKVTISSVSNAYPAGASGAAGTSRGQEGGRAAPWQDVAAPPPGPGRQSDQQQGRGARPRAGLGCRGGALSDTWEEIRPIPPWTVARGRRGGSSHRAAGSLAGSARAILTALVSFAIHARQEVGSGGDSICGATRGRAC